MLKFSPKLESYTPIPSNGCFSRVLRCLFSRLVSCLDAFSTYPLTRSCSACPVGQQIDQRRRKPVPLVLWLPSPQTSNISSRYQTNCLTAFWTQLTIPFNGWTPPPLHASARAG